MMLKRFSVEGFKNFEKKISIDLADVRDYKFHPECVTDGLLNTAIIYGKNAVGKSNFGFAMLDIVSHLTLRRFALTEQYYLTANNSKGYAEFEYVFQFGNEEIIYKYRKTTESEVIMEYLTLNSEDLLVNNSGELSIDGLKKIAPTLNWEFNEEESALKYFLYNSSIDNQHPLRKMREFIDNMVFLRASEIRPAPMRYSRIQEEDIHEFNTLLQQADINDKVVLKENSDGEMDMYFDTNPPMLFYRVASRGTMALYNFFRRINVKRNISFIYIDEFDAFYHYELSETIVTMLEKMVGVQKILTSHNTNLLSNRIMRPDCYFILTRNKLTSLANATERELREGHNLEKLYMSGEFDE